MPRKSRVGSRSANTGCPSLVPLALCFALLTPAAPAAGCEIQFDGTFALIQERIFVANGCASAFCHSGEAPAGRLDLTPGAAYRSLVNQPSATVDGAFRLVPGQKEDSLLWINVAAKTLPAEWTAPYRAMPPGSLFPPLSLDQLEVLRRWIEAGAPEEGVVQGTGELLRACLPPPKPIEIAPLPEPEPTEGIQIKMPRWEIDSHSERETCFASFYDATDRVPEEFRGASGDTFVYNRAVVRQDPLAHHLIVAPYAGTDLPDAAADWPPRRCRRGASRGARCRDDAECGGAPCAPVWPEFFCRGGRRNGEACNPLSADACGADAPCVTEVVSSIGCIGFGPADAALGLHSTGFIGSQETATVTDFADGVFAELPLRAIVFWSSSGLNPTSETGKLEAWLNFSFAAADERRFPVRTIFDVSAIFAAATPPFQAEEVCNHHVLPEGAQLFALSSHTHRHGKRFRTFRGAWRCEGGPREGAACSPTGPDPARGTPDLCAGFPCLSLAEPRAGDCDGDGRVTLNEIVLGLSVALARKSVADCRAADPSGDGAVGVDELLLAIVSALHPLRDPNDSLLYVNLTYDDPPRVRFEPPLSFPGRGSPRNQRTLTYCSVYDNGYGADASVVKRRSTSPLPPLAVPIGGPCERGEACVNEGRVGDPCSGESDRERDASCDSIAGASDGLCDACALVGGLTTEDEMFVLLGRFYVPE